VPRRDDLVVIEVALNGVHSKKHAAQIPTTPDEIAADMIRCLDAGASICHAHDAIAPDATPADLERIVAATYRTVLAEYPDAILYPASTWGGPLSQRWSHHAGLANAGLIKTGFVDPGSTNLGVLDADGVPAPTEFIYAHSYADVRWWFEECERLRLAPNLSIFEPGFLQAALAYERAGRLPAGTYARFYFGGGEYLTARPGLFSFGMPPLVPCLEAYLAMLEHSQSALPWFVAVLAGDVVASGLAREALERGGHVRVGLEDAAGARDCSNADLVDEIVALADEVGRRVATPAETAKLFGFPRA
jgi:3-keto-5-aminohexanoate cleavage enzyme